MESIKQRIFHKSHDPLGHVFSKYLYHEHREHRALITVGADATALECLRIMKKEKLLCLPVMNLHHEDRVIGLIDVMDISAYVVTLYDRTKGKELESGAQFNFDTVFNTFLEGRKATDLMNYSGRNFCYPLAEDVSFRVVLVSLCGLCHRIPILEKPSLKEILEKKRHTPLKQFVTRTDMLNFVNENLEFWGDSLDVPIHTANCHTCDPKTVLDSKITIDAFREMTLNHISAVAVIDNEGRLTGNLTARDVKYLLESPQNLIELPLSEFLSKVENRHSNYALCHTTNTMKHALTLMKGAAVHRVWIVDEHRRPIGVLSISDVCRFLNHIELPENRLEKLTHPIHEDSKSATMKSHLKNKLAEKIGTSPSPPSHTETAHIDAHIDDHKHKLDGNKNHPEVKQDIKHDDKERQHEKELGAGAIHEEKKHHGDRTHHHEQTSTHRDSTHHESTQHGTDGASAIHEKQAVDNSNYNQEDIHNKQKQHLQNLVAETLHDSSNEDLLKHQGHCENDGKLSPGRMFQESKAIEKQDHEEGHLNLKTTHHEGIHQDTGDNKTRDTYVDPVTGATGTRQHNDNQQY